MQIVMWLDISTLIKEYPVEQLTTEYLGILWSNTVCLTLFLRARSGIILSGFGYSCGYPILPLLRMTYSYTNKAAPGGHCHRALPPCRHRQKPCFRLISHPQFQYLWPFVGFLCRLRHCSYTVFSFRWINSPNCVYLQLRRLLSSLHTQAIYAPSSAMNELHHVSNPQGSSPTFEHGSPPEDSTGRSSSSGPGPGSTWKKRVSTACLACKKSKRKCSGTAPCDNCRAFRRVCVFDESLDQRRRVAAKRTADELTYHRDLLNDLFKLIREADESKALQLLSQIRDNAPPSEIRGYINDTLAGLGAARHKTSSETVAKVEDMRNLINVEDPVPAFRSKVMDIHYLCDEAPVKVPASPWTSVTEDADLVSHLVSLYFTWDYPFHAFLDEGVFLRHMAKGDLGSQFCSQFLVNAMLSSACVCCF